MIKVLHTSDLNIGADLPYDGAVVNALRQAQLATLGTLVDLAIAHEVQLFVVAGHLFSSHAPHESYRGPVLQQLQRLRDHQIHIALLPGCYDHPLGSDSVYAHPDFSEWVVKDRYLQGEPAVFELNEQTLNLYTLPWQIDAGESATGFMQRHHSDGVHVGVLHSHKLEAHQVNPYQENLVCWRPAIQAWDLDYVITGNRFADQLVDGEKILAYCPGTPQGLSFNDCGSRCCALVVINDGRVQLTKLQCHSVLFQRQELDVTGVDTATELSCLLLDRANRELALDVKLTGTIEELHDWVLLQKQCAAEFFLLELTDSTSFLNSRYVQQMAEEDTVRGILCRRMTELAAAGGDSHCGVYEMALRELLQRFNVVGEAVS
ncbi:MAG: hypothetical protein J7K75_10150 [Desulfuromonas sp.]|nr:hypothetical protein [Desulfuromonas sp.]